ncbi:MAG: hypothetical protein GY930_18745 [bacterium]|nr:hypothetical protein [bacterium]
MTGRLESDAEQAVRSGLDALQALALKQVGLQTEWDEAWGEFSQEAPPFENAQKKGSAACGRFREWFLLERHSATLMGTPMDRLLSEWRASHPDFTEHVEPLFLSSFTGIFEVGDLVEKQGAWLRDITGFGEFALQDPEGSGELHTGDLLVGRLYPVPGSLHVASGDATWIRSADLSKALEQDLNRMYGEGAKILRLAAPDLEAMFFHPNAPHRDASQSEATKEGAQSESAIAEAREFLTLAGWDRSDIERLFTELKGSPLDPSALAASAGDPVGQALEQFAFHTQVDLAEARRILTQAWMAFGKKQTAPEAAVTAANQGSCDTQEAVDRFAAAQASGGDMEHHFHELEQSLGLPADPVEEDTEKSPDFPGVVGAMVAEFQWDLERQNKAIPCWNDRLQPFAEYTRTIGAFEDLSRREVLSYCCFWTLEQDLLEGPGAAEETVQALEQFTLWAQQEHEMPLYEECKTLLGDLQSSLPRIVELNALVADQPAPDGSDSGQLFSVGETQDNGTTALIDRGGNQYTSFLPDSLKTKVQGGDHVRANINLEGHAQVFKIYPPEASELNAQ